MCRRQDFFVSYMPTYTQSDTGKIFGEIHGDTDIVIELRGHKDTVTSLLLLAGAMVTGIGSQTSRAMLAVHHTESAGKENEGPRWAEDLAGVETADR